MYSFRSNSSSLHLFRTGNKNLLNVGLRAACLAANRITVDRRIPPAQNLQAFFGGNSFQDAFALQTLVLLHGKEDHAHCILTWLRQFETQRGAFTGKKLMRNLYQHPGAVAGFWIAATRPAMGEVHQHLNPFADNLVALLSTHARDESHSASVVLIAGIV